MDLGRFFGSKEDKRLYLKAEKEAAIIQKEILRRENEELFKTFGILLKSFFTLKI